MIRAEVSWWPGNVSVGGTHIHHLVWGIIVLMLSGWIAIALDPGPPGRELAAVTFGIGTGLTLDEFALWLELKDVYWSKQRTKIDRCGDRRRDHRRIRPSRSVRSGSTPRTRSRPGSTPWLRRSWLFGLLLASICFLKEKFAVGLVGLFVPFVSLVGAVRLGRPTSPWARLAYGEAKQRRGVRPLRRQANDPPSAGDAQRAGSGPGGGGERIGRAVGGFAGRTGGGAPPRAIRREGR